MSDDRHSGFDYSRLIQWDERLKREWPLFEELLRGAPSKRILDLGSGTGEHARFLASKGFDVTGVDSSPAMLEKSRTAEDAGVLFLAGDMREISSVVEGQFGAAFCVGNVLPHLTGENDIAHLAAGLRRVLLPGAPFLLQIINYDRLEAKNERALPVTFLPDPDDKEATIIFLRTMDLQPDGRVIFMPTTLRQPAIASRQSSWSRAAASRSADGEDRRSKAPSAPRDSPRSKCSARIRKRRSIRRSRGT